MHTLYSKILFAGFGLLFASDLLGQDSLTIKGMGCEVFTKLGKDNLFENGKLFSGYQVKCDRDGIVNEIQYYKNGKFSGYPDLENIDSVLNKQIREYWKMRKQHNGKKYIYDKNGLIEKIEIYKNGKYIGDAQID